MRFVKRRALKWLMGGLLVGAVCGCTMIVDAFAPGLATNLGLDPATIKPTQGVVLVSFNNTTRFPTEFFAYEMGAQDSPNTWRSFSAEVAGGEVQNEVLDCPVEVISPGSVGADLSIDTTAAVGGGTATTGTGTETVTFTVAYEGPPLVSGRTFTCGDVIEIRLSQTGTADQADFVVSVRVIPGR